MRDSLQKMSLRELRLVLLGIGAVITSAIVVALIVPGAKAYVAANRQVDMLAGAAIDGTQLDLHLQEQHEQIDELRFRLHGDMANLPVQQVEAFIIGRLQRISWGNEVELVSVEPALGERVQIFQEMLFNVELVGQYNDLYHWLWDARSELGYIVIKEFSLERHDNEDDEPLLRADLSLASYRAIES